MFGFVSCFLVCCRAVRCGAVRFFCLVFGLVLVIWSWFGLVWFGLVWSDLVWFGLIWLAIIVGEYMRLSTILYLAILVGLGSACSLFYHRYASFLLFGTSMFFVDCFSFILR